MAATSGTTKLKVRWALVGCVGICILARPVQPSARPSARRVCAQRGGCADVPRAWVSVEHGVVLEIQVGVCDVHVASLARIAPEQEDRSR